MKQFKNTFVIDMRIDDAGYDEKNVESFCFHSDVETIEDLKNLIKRAVSEWVKSDDESDSAELDKAIQNEYGESLSDYYREDIDDEPGEDDERTPIQELYIGWRMVYMYLPDSIAERNGFICCCQACETVDDCDFNYDENYGNSHKCPKCGAEMRSMITDDPNCDHSLVEGYECPECGYDSVYDKD